MRVKLLLSVLASALGLLVGCGGMEEEQPSPTKQQEPKNPFAPSLPSSSSVTRCESEQSSSDQTCSCLGFSLQTMESCSMSVLDGHKMDGEGFIDVGGQSHRVFAMSRWSKGHVIAWCDGTTNNTLLQSAELQRYLGQKENPRMASFGNGVLCGPGYVPTGTTYLGGDLPTKYKGNASALAADYDALIFCGFALPWAWDFSRELTEFTTVHGRGLVLSMDYVGAPGLATEKDFDKMNAIANQAGLSFDKVKLGWATAKLDFKMECVPDLPQNQK